MRRNYVFLNDLRLFLVLILPLPTIVDSIKLRSWLGSDQFVAGVAPVGRECGQLMIVIKDKLYIFGGNEAAGFLNDLHIYHLTSRTWIDITASVQGIPPSPRYGQLCATVENKFYVFAGRSYTGQIVVSCAFSFP